MSGNAAAPPSSAAPSAPNQGSPERRQYSSMSEYCGDLRTWMVQVHQARCVEAMFPVWLTQQLNQAAAASQQSSTDNQRRDTQATGARAQQPPLQRGMEFRIPPLWKRLVAEIIDFFILMLIKFFIAFIAIDTFQLIDISKYDVETLLKMAGGSQANLSYNVAMEMTAELLMLEMINRVSVCWFEALCLQRGWGVSGGATPGKYALGLRVVRCDWVAPSLDDHVVLAPAGDIGFSRALLRSVIKNVSVTFCFPMFAAVFYLDHNRTPYDLLAGTLVVEPARR